MSRARGPYRKRQRYKVGRVEDYYGDCAECGAQLGYDHAEVELLSGKTMKLCPDCVGKVERNRFELLKDKDPEDMVEDLSDLLEEHLDEEE